jgi:hypothetical protein
MVRFCLPALLFVALTFSARAASISFDHTLYGHLGEVSASFSGIDVDGDGWISAYTDDVIERLDISATMYGAGVSCDDEGDWRTCSTYDLFSQASLRSIVDTEVKTDLSIIRIWLFDGYEEFMFDKSVSGGGGSATLVYYGRYLLTKSFSVGWNTEPMPPAVPLPASGFMLISVLIPVFALRYRRRAA